jgi:hypothetical protein
LLHLSLDRQFEWRAQLIRRLLKRGRQAASGVSVGDE